ncbi:MAG: ComF family protein [Bacteroidetes bacterium]|nr:ComF family protein [Bacteroidota bacterium]MCW5895214.1 ComF family protein [Bacteroidota bacterium]
MLEVRSSPLSTTLRAFYEFIYPPACLGCEEYLGETVDRICAACFQSIKPITQDDPLFTEMRERLVSGGYVDGLISAFHFEKDGMLQSLIHQLKYEEMTRAGFELGKKIGERVTASCGDISSAGLVPVPLHPSKRRERGYNQSVYVAMGIRSVAESVVYRNLLQRKRNTRTQTTLNIEERRNNVRSAFGVNSRYAAMIAGSSFLLVDDVITTGATIQECARVLKEHGAKSVFATSVALADHGTLKDTV